MNEIPLLKIQYEILNTPLARIADAEDIPLSMLEKEAKEGNWKQLWPNAEDLIFEVKDDEPTSAVERISLEAEQFIDIAKKRLKIYSLVKELYLAKKYLELEVAIVGSATVAAEATQDPQQLKFLSGIYKDLTSGSNIASLLKMSFGVDESGLPSVTIRDLSGK